jgi:hypothetical protein
VSVALTTNPYLGSSVLEHATSFGIQAWRDFSTLPENRQPARSTLTGKP